MRIIGGGGIAWYVVDGRGELVRSMAWADDDTHEWSDGITVFKAISVRIEIGLLMVTITRPEDVTEIPFEVHNSRPINADTCMAAVRAMSRGSVA